VLTWQDVHSELALQPPRTVIVLMRDALPDPRALGALVSIGLPCGQQADLRFAPDASCRGLHVQEFTDRWEAHLDQVHPKCDLLRHLQRDAPAALVAIVVVMGTLALVTAAMHYRAYGAHHVIKRPR